MNWNNIKEWAVKTVTGIFVFLDLDMDVVLILGYMMMIDTFWGVLKAAYVTRIKFSFKVLYIKMVGKMSFLFIPLTLALMAKGLDMDFTFFVEAIVKLMIITEGISIITNALSIKDNKPYTNGDFATQILHFIRNYLIMFFDKIRNGFGKIKDVALEEEPEDKNKTDTED